ncbi:hypothetical protein BDV96DRAFT_321195 [Lophiotrema nucula]|uniref:Uncharacterized protein n=1 Tax=Lophiotrema nucula TaxID=690887 RepID=A0A6A5ZPQ3_9PLEO|nr:hypothetical protein BDV96DRAFT_321195 [Lophiotrema nucula]
MSSRRPNSAQPQATIHGTPVTPQRSRAGGELDDLIRELDRIGEFRLQAQQVLSPSELSRSLTGKTCHRIRVLFFTDRAQLSRVLDEFRVKALDKATSDDKLVLLFGLLDGLPKGETPPKSISAYEKRTPRSTQTELYDTLYRLLIFLILRSRQSEVKSS